LHEGKSVEKDILSNASNNIFSNFKQYLEGLKKDFEMKTKDYEQQIEELNKELERRKKERFYYCSTCKKEINEEEHINITEDILGLDIIDKLERKIPDVFMGIKEIDYSEPHRKKIQEAFPKIEKNHFEELVNFLARLDATKPEKTSTNTIIYYGKDDFLAHVINTICKSLGIFVFSTDAQENLEIIINQSKLKGLNTTLIIDLDSSNETNIDYKDVDFIYFQKNIDAKSILTHLDKMALVVFPKPDNSDIQTLLLFYNSILNYFKRYESKEDSLAKFKETVTNIVGCNKISDITNIICGYLSQFYERIITFVLHQGFLITEKFYSIDTQTSPFKIPISELQKFLELKNENKVDNFFFNIDPNNPIYKYIPISKDKKYFLQTMTAFGKIISLIYCDNQKKNLNSQFIEILHKTANLQIENILYRKMFEKSKKTE
jgi:hypothetical protein